MLDLSDTLTPCANLGVDGVPNALPGLLMEDSYQTGAFALAVVRPLSSCAWIRGDKTTLEPLTSDKMGSLFLSDYVRFLVRVQNYPLLTPIPCSRAMPNIEGSHTFNGSLVRSMDVGIAASCIKLDGVRARRFRGTPK